MKKIIILILALAGVAYGSFISTGSGSSSSGDIVGPATSTAFALASYADTTGNLLLDNSVTLNTAGVLRIPLSTVGDGTTNAITFGTGAVGMSNVAGNNLRLSYRGQEHSFRNDGNLQMINFSQDGIYLYPTIGSATDYAIINYDTNSSLSIETSGYPVQLKAGAEVGVKITTTGSAILGKASLGTGATGGFAYIPAMNGTPSGTPVTQTGYVPIVYDTNSESIYVYNGGWRQFLYTLP